MVNGVRYRRFTSTGSHLPGHSWVRVANCSKVSHSVCQLNGNIDYLPSTTSQIDPHISTSAFFDNLKGPVSFFSPASLLVLSKALFPILAYPVFFPLILFLLFFWSFQGVLTYSSLLLLSLFQVTADSGNN